MDLFCKLLGASLLILFSVTSQAQDYYVCDTTGNDSNFGRSEAKPFKTYQKIMSKFSSLEAGSSILFCRGGNFTVDEASRLSNSKCSASKQCRISSFGDENLERPIIVSNGINVFNFENGGDARADGGFIVENLTLISTQKNGAGIRLFNDVDDVTVSNLHIQGFNIGVYSAGSNKPAAGSSANGMNDRLLVRNSTIVKNAKMGFLGACNDCLIENNHFEDNGDKAIFDHNIYLAHTGVHAKGITIRNNMLYKSAIVDGKCQGVSLVGHGHLEDVLIEGNTIKEDLGKVTAGCWGISIDPGYGNKDESFRNIIIRKNKIINVGGVGVGCASCDGVTIENNEIVDEANLITAGIKVPVRKEDSTKSRNIKVFNNKIVLSHESASGVWVGGENVSKVYGNEIILPTKTRVDCVSLNQASLSIDISTNLCKNHNGIAIIDDTNNTPPNEDSVAENTVDEDILDDENSDIDQENSAVVDPDVSDSEIENDSTATPPEQTENNVIVDNKPESENDLINSPPSDIDNIEVVDNNIPEPENNYIETPVEQINEVPAGNDLSENSLTPVTMPQTTSNTFNRTLDGDNEQQLSIMGGNANNRSSGGGSSGSPSKSSKSSVGSTGDDQNSGDPNKGSIAYFETIQPPSDELENLEFDTAVTAESKTIQNSSPSITKMKDVIKASQEDLSNIDPNQCRASANGKCLMK